MIKASEGRTASHSPHNPLLHFKRLCMCVRPTRDCAQSYTEVQFAPLLFAKTIVSALALGGYPQLAAQLGDASAIRLSASIGLVAVTVSFAFQAPYLRAFTVPLHVFGMLVFFASYVALDPAITSVISMFFPTSVQGRVFAGVAIAKAIGGSLSGVLGSQLFGYSLALDLEGGETSCDFFSILSVVICGGALPFLVLGPAMIVCYSLLYHHLHQLHMDPLVYVNANPKNSDLF